MKPNLKKLADQVERLVNQAISQFGRIDKQANKAGVTIYGKLTQVPLSEKRGPLASVAIATGLGLAAAVGINFLLNSRKTRSFAHGSKPKTGLAAARAVIKDEHVTH